MIKGPDDEGPPLAPGVVRTRGDFDRCPRCGEPLEYEEVDIGIGTMKGNPGCPSCHWTPNTVDDDETIIIMVACPECGEGQEDLDGFGVLHCPKCGYCKHVSVTGGVCGLCGKRVEG